MWFVLGVGFFFVLVCCLFVLNPRGSNTVASCPELRFISLMNWNTGASFSIMMGFLGLPSCEEVSPSSKCVLSKVGIHLLENIFFLFFNICKLKIKPQALPSVHSLLNTGLIWVILSQIVLFPLCQPLV